MAPRIIVFFFLLSFFASYVLQAYAKELDFYEFQKKLLEKQQDFNKKNPGASLVDTVLFMEQHYLNEINSFDCKAGEEKALDCFRCKCKDTGGEQYCQTDPNLPCGFKISTPNVGEPNFKCTPGENLKDPFISFKCDGCYCHEDGKTMVCEYTKQTRCDMVDLDPIEVEEKLKTGNWAEMQEIAKKLDMLPPEEVEGHLRVLKKQEYRNFKDFAKAANKPFENPSEKPGKPIHGPFVKRSEDPFEQRKPPFERRPSKLPDDERMFGRPIEEQETIPREEKTIWPDVKDFVTPTMQALWEAGRKILSSVTISPSTKPPGTRREDKGRTTIVPPEM